MYDRKKVIELMSMVITKWQNNDYYTIIDNFQRHYIDQLFVVRILLILIALLYNRKERK